MATCCLDECTAKGAKANFRDTEENRSRHRVLYVNKHLLDLGFALRFGPGHVPHWYAKFLFRCSHFMYPMDLSEIKWQLGYVTKQHGHLICPLSMWLGKDPPDNSNLKYANWAMPRTLCTCYTFKGKLPPTTGYGISKLEIITCWPDDGFHPVAIPRKVFCWRLFPEQLSLQKAHLSNIISDTSCDTPAGGAQMLVMRGARAHNGTDFYWCWY